MYSGLHFCAAAQRAATHELTYSVGDVVSGVVGLDLGKVVLEDSLALDGLLTWPDSSLLAVVLLVLTNERDELCAVRVQELASSDGEDEEGENCNLEHFSSW